MDTFEQRYFNNNLSKSEWTSEDRDRVRDAVFTYAKDCVNALPTLRSPTIYTGAPQTPTAYYTQALTIVEQELSRFHASRFVTFVEGKPGALALQAVLLHALRHDRAAYQKPIAELKALIPSIKTLPQEDCEVLYGRAGFLSAVYFLRENLKEPTLLQDDVIDILAQVIDEGIRNGKRYEASQRIPPLLYFWHGKAYLGAAHGLIGILIILLRFRSAFSVVAPRVGLKDKHDLERLIVDSTCTVLHYSTDSHGTVASSLSSRLDKESVLVHWCHGAPGMALLLTALLEERLGNSQDWNRAADVISRAIWKKGLLKKGLGLCHGIGGNGLALLRLADVTQVAERKAKAYQFALFGIAHFRELYNAPDRPASMFEGLAGFVWFLCDCLSVTTSAAFPGM